MKNTQQDMDVWADWPLILAYHSVSEERKDGLAVRPADFERQMRWLASHGYRSITLAEHLRRPARRGEKVVIITFDDGYADTYTQAFPILRRYGFTAVVFLVTSYVGREHVFWWDEEKVNVYGRRSLYYPLTWEQAGELLDCGMELGSHTSTHPPALTRLEPGRCWDEIAASKLRLERQLGVEVSSFCYPRGDLDPAVVKMVEAAGYRGAVVTPPRYGIPLSRYTLRRISLYREYTPLHFRLMTSPFFRRNYESFKRLRRLLMPWIAARSPGSSPA